MACARQIFIRGGGEEKRGGGSEERKGPVPARATASTTTSEWSGRDVHWLPGLGQVAQAVPRSEEGERRGARPCRGRQSRMPPRRHPGARRIGIISLLDASVVATARFLRGAAPDCDGWLTRLLDRRRPGSGKPPGRCPGEVGTAQLQKCRGFELGRAHRNRD
jgi:hypothetical protein